MTTVAIMQPTYLPWCGYFDLLDQADVFVLLDTVAVSKQSWQTRNRIRARDGNVVWLSVPINASQGALIKDVVIANKQWAGKQRRTIESAYGHAPWWGHISELLMASDPWPFRRLCDVTVPLIREIASKIGIGELRSKVVLASTLGVSSVDPIGRLRDICSAVEATEYLSPEGARGYLEGHDIGVPIRWHEYEHPVYDQGGAEFVSHLSVVDLLAWHGPASLDIIRSGRNGVA
jgi:hypothetical protein